METHTLDCGLRIISAPSSSNVVYCGIAVDAGTRDELPHESGLAHFTEHLTFKGTPRRRSWHILNRMESVGGDLNAYTGKEETVYYSTFLKEHFPRAIDLLIDITLNSTFPQHEMDKEVEVVIDEIESYNDSPSELIFDEFEGIIFHGHPLGRSILGRADRLREFCSADVLRFTQRLYTPSHMVLFVFGDIPMNRIIRETEKAISRLINREGLGIINNDDQPFQSSLNKESGYTRCKPLPLTDVEPKTVRKMDTHQAHVMIGTRGVPLEHPHHLSLYLLNNILGGPSMNSRFNLALRERNGLVYTVESNLTTYTDAGMWNTYFGCDPNDVERCLHLVRKELNLLTEAPLSENALERAKRQIIGQIGISYDAFESVAIGMGKRLLHYGTTLSHEQLIKQIQQLTPKAVYQAACDIFQPDSLITLIYQ